MIEAVGDISGIKNGQWPAIDKFEDPQLLASLLNAGLSPDITDKKGNPILYQCASHPDCLELLLKAGADVDKTNSRGETAFMRATYVGDLDCVQVLLDGGANPTIEFPPFARVMMGFNGEMMPSLKRPVRNGRQRGGSYLAQSSPLRRLSNCCRLSVNPATERDSEVAVLKLVHRTIRHQAFHEAHGSGWY